MAKSSPFIKPIERVASGTTLVPREQAVSYNSAHFDVTDDPATLYSDSAGASVEGASVVSLKAGLNASDYIRPTGSGGSSGLGFGRYDINSTNPYAPIPGQASFGNDDGSNFSLQIDCGSSAITSNFDLTVNGFLQVTGNLAADSGMVLNGGLSINSGGLAVTGTLNAGFCNIGSVVAVGSFSVTGGSTFSGNMTLSGSSNLLVGGFVQAAKGLTLTPQTAPSAPANGWAVYCDSGDGNKLKAIASTGTIITLGTP